MGSTSKWRAHTDDSLSNVAAIKSGSPAGIGVTPFVSRVKELSAAQSDVHIDFYYVVRTKADAVFLAELEQCINETGIANQVTLRLWESAVHDRFTVEKMEQRLVGPDYRYFICGPAAMLHDVKRGLRRAGIKRHNIVLEEFRLY